MLDEKRDKLWLQQIQEADEDQGNFWKLLKRIGKQQAPNAPLKSDGKLLYDDAEKAEATATFLETQFSFESTSDHKTIAGVERSWNKISRANVVDATTVTVDKVKELIQKINSKKAPGNDGIPNRALKIMDKNPLALRCILLQICNMSRGNKFLTQAELDYLAENLNLSESEDEYENLSDDSNYLPERDEVDEENDVENTENMPTNEMKKMLYKKPCCLQHRCYGQADNFELYAGPENYFTRLMRGEPNLGVTGNYGQADNFELYAGPENYFTRLMRGEPNLGVTGNIVGGWQG
ncbi:hypothetical protein QE152_g24379 [Popillia japonica]|uniref:Uncharacterized protein n=1 Tax=Popillia japonica TaxID=7064 RepID=A0AAW1KGW3_POPJA